MCGGDVGQVTALEGQLASAVEEKRTAERKRDASEQRRCDALLEQGRIQAELDTVSLAAVRQYRPYLLAVLHFLLVPLIDPNESIVSIMRTFTRCGATLTSLATTQLVSQLPSRSKEV